MVQFVCGTETIMSRRVDDAFSWLKGNDEMASVVDVCKHVLLCIAGMLVEKDKKVKGKRENRSTFTWKWNYNWNRQIGPIK